MTTEHIELSQAVLGLKPYVLVEWEVLVDRYFERKLSR